MATTNNKPKKRRHDGNAAASETSEDKKGEGEGADATRVHDDEDLEATNAAATANKKINSAKDEDEPGRMEGTTAQRTVKKAKPLPAKKTAVFPHHKSARDLYHHHGVQRKEAYERRNKMVELSALTQHQKVGKKALAKNNKNLLKTMDKKMLVTNVKKKEDRVTTEMPRKKVAEKGMCRQERLCRN